MPDEDVQFVADHFRVKSIFQSNARPVYKIAERRGIEYFTRHMPRRAPDYPPRDTDGWAFSAMDEFPNPSGSFVLYRYFCEIKFGYIGVSAKPLVRHKAHMAAINAPRCPLTAIVVAASRPEYLLYDGRLALFATREGTEAVEREAIQHFASLGWRLTNRQDNPQWCPRTKSYDWLAD